MKKHFFIFAFLLFSVVAISIFTSPTSTPVVMAGSSDNVSGYAWSETIGWISFNCTDISSCGTADYGVNIAPTTGIGIYSGYAWSENIGWIDFAPVGPYPEAPNNFGQIDWTTGVVTGWARALSSGGGWDGWIKLAGTAVDGSSYGVIYNSATNEFTGYAWGFSVVGWIDFNPAGSGGFGSVTLTIPNNPPLTPVISGPATGIINTTISNFTASSTDPEGDDILYLIDWGDGNNDTTALGSYSGSFLTLPSHTWTATGVYAIQVIAEDENGAQSPAGTHTITISNPQCSDTADNDGDTWTDFPNDPGCSSATDNSESPNPQCSDLVDNDGDGSTDLADAGCADKFDNDESNCGDDVCNGNETYFSCPQDNCPLKVQEF